MYETVSGQSSNDDAETMFQLLHLRFTSPRKDPEAFESFKSRMRGVLESQGARPDQVFSDSVNWTMAGHHPRARPWTVATLDKLDLDKSFSFYRQRFSNAGDFTFVIVGSFEPAEIRPLVETYLASLPGSGAKESWKDVGIETPEGEINKLVRKGVDQKGQVRIVYTGDFDWSMENRHKLQSLVEVLRMKLRETLREEKGGVYSPAAWGQYQQYPNKEYELNIFFGCDPDREEELIDAAESIVDDLKNNLVDQSYVDKVREIQRRQRETTMKENSYWLSSLQFYMQNDEPLTNILDYGELYKNLTPEVIRNQARKYFGENRMIFTLKPEEGSGS
jgi:zinc protease